MIVKSYPHIFLIRVSLSLEWICLLPSWDRVLQNMLSHSLICASTLVLMSGKFSIWILSPFLNLKSLILFDKGWHLLFSRFHSLLTIDRETQELESSQQECRSSCRKKLIFSLGQNLQAQDSNSTFSFVLHLFQWYWVVKEVILLTLSQ